MTDTIKQVAPLCCNCMIRIKNAYVDVTKISAVYEEVHINYSGNDRMYIIFCICDGVAIKLETHYTSRSEVVKHIHDELAKGSIEITW